MKKIITFLFLSLFFLLPIKVNAIVEGSIDVSCSKTNPSAGETINCTITGTITSGSVSGIELDILPSPNLISTNCTASPIWQGVCNDFGHSSLFTPSYKTGTFSIASFSVKVDDFASRGIDENITIIVAFSDEEHVLNAMLPEQITINISSAINTLSSLGLSEGTISPVFNSNTTTYSATVNSNTVNVLANKTDSFSSFVNNFGPRTVNLNYGNNVTLIKVLSESSVEKIYTINITRPDNRSTNNKLATLTISNGSINFDANTLTYNVTVNKDITNITVGATLEDSKASFVTNYGPRTVNLNVGNNVILIKAISENGVEKTYTINVTRPDNKSTNNNLKELSVSAGTLVFRKDVLDYRITVPYTTTTIDINAVAEDTKATVKTDGGKNLIVGDTNVATITVTAENGSKKTYTINITRQEENAKPLSSNNYLKTLEIEGYKLSFDKETLVYNLTIKEDNLNITTTTEDDKAVVKIVGNNNLKTDDKINIEVTAEDGNVKTYTINIEIKDNKTSLILISTLSFTAVAAGVVTTIFIKKKNKLKIPKI